MSRATSNRRPIMAALLAAVGVALVWLTLGNGNAGEGDELAVPPSPPEPEMSESVAWAGLLPAPKGTRTFQPQRSDEVLTNPGMGFASFHFGWWCNLPPITYPPEVCAQRVRQHWPERYPDAATAYFRWHWREIEPARGEIAFDVIDAAIQSANRLGMTLGFRVMTVEEGRSGLPDWLMDGPDAVAGQWLEGGAGSTFWPDYRDETFQREHARLIEALARRYDGHPAVDHVDIGSVGCWGEWNTACLSGVDSIIEVYRPSGRTERAAIEAAYRRIIDVHLGAYSTTPVLMLSLAPEDVGLMVHATRNGAGWRADCWGDWGLWGGSWSHQTRLYPQMIAAATKVDPAFPDVWKRAPVHLEVCGTMERWNELGWSASKPDGKVRATFDWALAQRASLVNGKSKPVPQSYGPAIEGFLKRVGYRFVVEGFNHPLALRAGERLEVTSLWSNLGVAPAYGKRELVYRLRRGARSIPLVSTQDTRTWLPGRFRVVDAFTLPEDLSPGTYQVELAVLDRDGVEPNTKALPPLFLGIAGRQPDGWYAMSSIEVEADSRRRKRR